MISVRLPPTFIEATPSSQPPMTRCRPMEKSKGSLRSTEGVEFRALRAVLVEPAGIVHDARLAGLRRGAGADAVSMICKPEAVVMGFPAVWADAMVEHDDGRGNRSRQCGKRGLENGASGRSHLNAPRSRDGRLSLQGEGMSIAIFQCGRRASVQPAAVADRWRKRRSNGEGLSARQIAESGARARKLNVTPPATAIGRHSRPWRRRPVPISEQACQLRRTERPGPARSRRQVRRRGHSAASTTRPSTRDDSGGRRRRTSAPSGSTTSNQALKSIAADDDAPRRGGSRVEVILRILPDQRTVVPDVLRLRRGRNRPARRHLMNGGIERCPA